MNKCCEHLFREAKKELAIRDKRIAEIQSECTRLFESAREFWNMERIEEMRKLNEELQEANQILWEIQYKWKDTVNYEQAAFEIRKVLDKHSEYMKRFERGEYASP